MGVWVWHKVGNRLVRYNVVCHVAAVHTVDGPSDG